MRVRRNISIDAETAEKLVELADRSHKNVSQWITDRVWQEAKEIDNMKTVKKKRKGSGRRNEQT